MQYDKLVPPALDWKRRYLAVKERLVDAEKKISKADKRNSFIIDSLTKKNIAYEGILRDYEGILHDLSGDLRRERRRGDAMLAVIQSLKAQVLELEDEKRCSRAGTPVQ